jgi:general secretion pathway protein D
MRPDPPAAEQGTEAAGRPDEKRLSHPAVVPAAGKGMFALNFDDADVYMTIQTVFGEALKLNYVVDPRVKGRVTFRAVSPIPRESVLPLMEVILRLNGIGMVEDNGLYRIVPISDISKEPSPVSYGRNPESIPVTGKSLVQVVPILYAQSSEILKLITPFASTNALLIDVPKGKQIIIVDTDANVKRLLKLVEVFDNEGVKRKKPQVFTYQVQNGKAKDIATLLQQIFVGSRGAAGATPATSSTTVFGGQSASSPAASGFPGASPSMTSTSSVGAELLVSEFTRIIHDEITNQIVILSSPEDYASIKETIERIDLVPRQVVIEGMIASVALTDNLSLGLAGLLKGNILNLDASFGLNLGSLNVDKNGLSTSGFTFVGTDIGGQVRGLITALATESKAKLLATPYILVSDNKEAKIQVGQQVPLVTSETYGTTGVAPMRSIQYRDIGIILKVKPRVNDGGLVTLDVDQEVSTFSTITLFANEQQIILNKTAATTNLVVQDNQTLVIGGLIREDTSKSRSGIPFLSKIPFLGWLFGNTNDNTTRQELIILLTPHVVKNQAEAKNLSSDYIDNMAESSKGRIKKEELMKAGTGKGIPEKSPAAGGGRALPVNPPESLPATGPFQEGR